MTPTAEVPLPPEGVADLPAAEVGDTDKRDLVDAVEATFETLLTWDYRNGERSPIDALYKRAKTQQWDAELDIDWGIRRQIERAMDPSNPSNLLRALKPDIVSRMSEREQARVGHATAAWTVSQFLHAEQGGLVCASKVVQAAPSMDVKFTAASQVMDEARHVEVYTRYLHEKLEWEFPVNPHLESLIHGILTEPRWDFTLLGMQVVIEGLALAAFGLQYRATPDPLLRQIIRYVIADEARHVALGVLSLREAYEGMTAAELKERQEFCYASAVQMCDRYLAEDMWEALDLPVDRCVDDVRRNAAQQEFRHSLFAKVVPNLKTLGLLDLGDGWLRERLGRLGVLEFEALADASEEYTLMDLDHAPWEIVRAQHY